MKRNCRTCGTLLPPLNRYDTDWCWMCWRGAWEAEYSRYYIKTETKNGLILYEEVQSLRGQCPFQKKNQPLIQTEIKKAKKNLKNIK